MLDKIRHAPFIFGHDRTARRDETGATAVEYALMTAFIAAVIVSAVAALGAQVVALFGLGVAAFP